LLPGASRAVSPCGLIVPWLAAGSTEALIFTPLTNRTVKPQSASTGETV
jgi:hypothetical protein